MELARPELATRYLKNIQRSELSPRPNVLNAEQSIAMKPTADLNFENVSGVYAFFFRVAGVLPFEGRDLNFIGSRLIKFYHVIFGGLMLIMYFVFDFNVLMSGKLPSVEDACISMLLLGSYYRYFILSWRSEEFAELFEECRQLWQFCDIKGRVTVKSYESKIRWIYLASILSSLAHMIMLPVDSYNARLPPAEPNGTERRVLLYRWFIEDEPEKLIGYGPTFTIQTIMLQNVAICSTTCDASLSLLVMLGAGYFSQLKDRLYGCATANIQDDDDGYDEIMRCVKYHQKLLRYCFQLGKFSDALLLAHLIITCYSISMILIELTAGSDPDHVKNITLILVCMLQLFVIQWTADRLTDQNEAVAFAVYSLLMTRLDDKRYCRQNLQIVLARAQIPVRFVIGGFFELSLENYGIMVKKAFSFFMVLRTFEIQ